MAKTDDTVTRKKTVTPKRKKAEVASASDFISLDSSLDTGSSDNITPEERARMIADTAYYRAQARGFEDGYELEDWLQAESEVDGRYGTRH